MLYFNAVRLYISLDGLFDGLVLSPKTCFPLSLPRETPTYNSIYYIFSFAPEAAWIDGLPDDVDPWGSMVQNFLEDMKVTARLAITAFHDSMA